MRKPTPSHIVSSVKVIKRQHALQCLPESAKFVGIDAGDVRAPIRMLTENAMQGDLVTQVTGISP